MCVKVPSTLFVLKNETRHIVLKKKKKKFNAGNFFTHLTLPKNLNLGKELLKKNLIVVNEKHG